MDKYICSECTNQGVKLWREYNRLYNNNNNKIPLLFCFDCISKKVPNIKITEKGTVFIYDEDKPDKFPRIFGNGEIFVGSYFLVPAVPKNFELNSLEFISFYCVHNSAEYLQWLELPNKVCIFNFPKKLLN